MNLRNRFNQFFNKSKSADAAPDVAEAEAASEQPASPDAPDWDILREETAEPEITYDDLARLVRFPGATPDASKPVAETTEFESPVNTLENANGGGSLFAESRIESEPISPELQAFKNFFKTDMRIKRELIDLAPKQTDDYDEAARMDYVEGAYRTFRDFKHDFLGIARDFGFGKPIEDSTEDFFRRGQETFAIGDYGPQVTQGIYRKAFTDLSPAFVEEVKDAFVGYKLFGGSLNGVIEDASTINELLHAYHSSIMNNENILRKIPALAEKKALYGDPVVLRGDRSALGQQVFDAIPEGFDIGMTDIVTADDHLMMMVRDRGHALTISSEPDEQDPSKIWVAYNIPKICNEEMIKSLPGLSGYTKIGARGSFVTSRDELGSSLVDFISKVPTDDDRPTIGLGDAEPEYDSATERDPWD